MRLEKLWISCDGVAELRSNDLLRAHAIKSETPKRGIAADFRAFDEAQEKLIVEISGLRMRSVSAAGDNGNSMTITISHEEHLCQELAWKPDLNLLSNAEVSALCAGQDVVQSGLDADCFAASGATSAAYGAC